MTENENENETTSQSSTGSSGSGSGARTAVKAAAAAAATGAAAVAVRKALSSNGKSHASKNGDADGHSSSGGSFLTSIASGGWDAARDALVPLAEDAAGAAGTYLAKNGPEFVRETIVPRFIKAFNEAQEG